MGKSPRFVLKGKSFQVVDTAAVHERVLKFLESSKVGELFTSVDLCRALNVTIRESVRKKNPNNWQRCGGTIFWGSRRTIIAFRAAQREIK